MGLIDLKKFKIKYKSELDFLKEKGGLVGDWSNVYNHCFTEGLAAYSMSKLLNLNEKDSNDLIKAALLHDWFKKNEGEAVKKLGYKQYDSRAKEGEGKLKQLGYSDRVVELTASVGHSSLKEMINSEDLLRRVMHYIDDITVDDKISSIDERVNHNESVERYKDLNESGRIIFNGRTYFELQRELGHKIENELALRIGCQENEVIPRIKNMVSITFGISY